jgi:two-component system CheB/CheR fusion protein
LNPGGILFLGKSESVAGFSSLFSIADKTNKIYIKKGVTTPLKLQMSLLRPNSVERINTAISRVEPLPERVDLQRESDRIALAKFAPPSVVINEVLEIIQSRGRTTPFLQLSPGHASLNLLRMAHPELSAKLKKAIQTSRAKNVPVTQEGLQIHDEGRKRFLSIHVIPIPSLSMVKESYLTIFFEETDQRSEHSIGK